MSIKLGPALKIYNSILMFKHAKDRSQSHAQDRSHSHKEDTSQSHTQDRTQSHTQDRSQSHTEDTNTDKSWPKRSRDLTDDLWTPIFHPIITQILKCGSCDLMTHLSSISGSGYWIKTSPSVQRILGCQVVKNTRSVMTGGLETKWLLTADWLLKKNSRKKF